MIFSQYNSFCTDHTIKNINIVTTRTFEARCWVFVEKSIVSAATEEILWILWKQKVNYRAHKGSNLNLLQPIEYRPRLRIAFKVNFNIIFSSTLRRLKRTFSVRASD